MPTAVQLITQLQTPASVIHEGIATALPSGDSQISESPPSRRILRKTRRVNPNKSDHRY